MFFALFGNFLPPGSGSRRSPIMRIRILIIANNNYSIYYLFEVLPLLLQLLTQALRLLSATWP